MLAAVVLVRAALAALVLVVLLIALVATVVTAQQRVRSVRVQAAVRRWAALRVVVAADETHYQLAVVALLATQRQLRAAVTAMQAQ